MYILRHILILSLIFCSLIVKANTLQDLAWLAGNWQSHSQEGIFEERWSKPTENNMLGSARFIRLKGPATFFELISIEQNKKNWEMHIMHFGPKLVMLHEKPLVYRLIQHTSHKLTFENIGTDPVHYIIYQQVDKKTLIVSLQTAKAKTKKQFKFKSMN
jgi:hypothetical protein